MELRRGVVKAFDPASYTATVQVAGSLGNWLSGVPVAKHLSAGLLAPGARCGLIFFDPANPQDTCLAFVYEGAPGAWVSDGMLEGNIAGSKVVAASSTARGTVELAEAGEAAASLAVQANDPRLSDARTPTEHDAGKHTNRTRSIWLPPRVFGATQGTPVLVAFGVTGADSSHAWAFDAAADESIGTSFELPSDWVPGTAVNLYCRWAADTATTGDVLWYLTLTSIADGDSIDEIYSYNPSATGAAPATARTRTTTLISSVAGSNFAAGSTVRIRVARLGSFAADTMTGDALLLGVFIEYTADM